MPVIEIGHGQCNEGVSDDEKEDIEEKGLEVKRENSKGRGVLSDEVERGDIGHEGSEEHVDLKDDHHLGYLVIAQLRNSRVI